MGRYTAFGFTIESPVELPEAFPCAPEGPPDITVKLGPVDISGLGAPESGRWVEIQSPKRLLFRCDAGVYDIRDGACVTIDPEPEAPPEKLRIFLMGSALGAAQIQRGRTPIHGGAVYSRGGAVVITGIQGAGKSTMTSALVRLGYKYLADDVSSAELAGDIPIVHAAYPQRKLERAACVKMGFDPDTLPVADLGRDKFAILDSANWPGRPAPFRILADIVPCPEGGSLHAEEITGHARLRLVTRSLYRPQMHMRDGRMPPGEFKKLVQIAAAVRMYRVYVPRGADNLLQYARELAAALEMSPDDR